jgi:hypothetical protein
MKSAPLGSTTPSVQTTEEKEFPPWARFAGVATVIVTASSAVVNLSMPGQSHYSSPVGAAITIVIGIMLAWGRHSIIPLARLRAWLGAIFGIPLMFILSGSAEAAFQAIFAISLVLLLGDKPGRLRAGTGAVLMALALGLVGLSSLVIAFPGALNQFTYRNQTLAIPSDGIIRTEHYRIGFPGSGWSQLKPEIVKQQQPIFDIWALRPDLDIHTAVVCEEGTIEPNEFKQNVIKNSQKVQLELVGSELHKRGTILHWKSAKGSAEVETIDLLVIGSSHLYQVHCWCIPEQYSKAEPQFRKIFDNFEPVE